jgi:DNA-binding LacI/PurR family transcriptional regulator
MQTDTDSGALKDVPTLASRVSDALRREIATKLKPGDTLPGMHALCRRFDVSINTVGAALEVLAREGLIDKRQGRSVRVAERPRNLPVAIYSELDLLHPRTSFFYRQLSRALREFFDRAGQESTLYMGRTQPGENPEEPTCRSFLNDLEAKRFAGVVFCNAAYTEGWGKWAARFPLPSVGAWFQHSTVTDYAAMVAEGVRALTEQGCRRPALLAWGSANVAPPFQAAVKAHGLQYLPDWVRGDLHPQLSGAGWEEFREIWHARSEQPDGLLVCDDLLFEDAKTAILGMGIDVPGKLRIVTHANKGSGFHYPFPVTLLEVDPEADAVALGGMLLKLLRHEPVEPATVSLPFRIRQAGGAWDADNSGGLRRTTGAARVQ